MLGSGDYVNKMFLGFISEGERQTIKKINSMSDRDRCPGGKTSNKGGVGSPGKVRRPQPFYTGFRGDPLIR